MSSVMPVGFRFQPKDAELVSYYLYSKVNGQESVFPPLFYSMPEADTYAEEPWQIWERLGGQQGLDDQDSLYFFAIPKKNGKRFDRRTKSGTWSEGEPSKPVRDVNGDPIGTKRKFRFESKDCLHHAAWQMEEYSSNFSHHWVLCHLKKNKPKNNKCIDYDPSRSTGVKPKNNKRLRRVDHQQLVVENMPSNDPSTSTEMPQNNKRLRKVTPSPSNNSYFETELPQCSTTTCSITDNNQHFTMGEIFDSAEDLGSFMPISDVEEDWDNILNNYGDYLQQNSLLSAQDLCTC